MLRADRDGDWVAESLTQSVEVRWERRRVQVYRVTSGLID